MTMEAFLEWESRQALKYEFDGSQPVAMNGVTVAHSTIQGNLLGILFNGLRGHRCKAHGSDLKIRVVGRIRYPDAFVVCSPMSPDTLIIDDPVIVFEILSPSTSYKDRIEKNREYRATPSIQRYVILEQSRTGGTVYTRSGSAWDADFVLPGGMLAMPEIGLTIKLDDLYEGIDMPPVPEDDPDEG
jgi:Uma2 family endonuclease